MTAHSNGQGVWGRINSLPDTTKFCAFPDSKSLQTTILNLIKTAESSQTGWKTLWEKKLLLTSNIFLFPLCFQNTADT